MQTSERVIDKLVEALNVFKLQQPIIDLLEDYLLGERNDAEIEKVLNELKEEKEYDIEDYNSSFRQAFYALDDYEGEEIYNRFLKICLSIGGESVLNIWPFRTWMRRDYKKTFAYFKQADIPFEYYILNYGNQMMEWGEIGDHKYFNRLENLCDIDCDAMSRAFEKADHAPKILIGAVLWKKGMKIDGLEEWVVSCLTHNLSIFLKDEMQFTEQQLKQVTDWLQEEELTSLSIHKKCVESFTFHFLISLNYYMKDDCTLSSRVLKLLLELDSIASIHRLFDYFERTFEYRSVPPVGFFQELERLVNDLHIPKEYYVVWLAEQTLHSDYELFSKRLRLFRQSPDIFVKALQLSYPQSKAVLASLLCECGQLEIYLSMLEDEVQTLMITELKDDGMSEEQTLSLVHYIEGKVERPIVPKLEWLRLSDNLIQSILLLKGKSPLFEKYVHCVTVLSSSDPYIFRHFTRYYEELTNGTLQEIINILDKLQVEATATIPAIANIGHYDGKYEQIVRAYIEEHIEEVIEGISACDVDGRELILTEAKEIQWEADQFDVLLIQLMGDSSKRIRQLVIDLLNERPNNKQLVLPLLQHKKAVVREQAVILLSNYTDQEVVHALEEMFEKERSHKVKELISKAIHVEELEEEQDITSLAKYCEKHLNKRKKAKAEWVTPETLPALMVKDPTEDLTDDVVYLLLTMFADTDEVTLNTSARKLAEWIEEKSLHDIAYEVLLRWVADGAQAKRKWVLSLAAQFGDSRVIHELSSLIADWVKSSRGAIASLAVKALALQGSDEALLITDGIAQKIKHKQVKRAASEALEAAAKEFGITPEELADRLIPTLGFDQEGKRVFDYGSRSFTVEVTPEQTLQIFKEDGKSVKNLPQVAKSDDEQKATDAREQFKLLKKQLKTVVTNQKTRLEAALSKNRLWEAEKWEKLFVDNVIMQSFAIGLVWGVYEEGELVQSFRYMDDGTFNTIDEDEYELPEGASIGLVHPLDLEADEIEQWKEQLEDYEILQPIAQLDRPIFIITEEEKNQKEIIRFAGRQMSDLALLGRMDKAGWSKGSVQDAGGFYEFYKEIGEYGAELHMTGMYVGGGMDDVVVKEVIFYTAGTVERGSYVYDEVTDKNRIMPNKVPERIFSELLLDVSKATEKYDKLVEKWQEASW